MLRLRTAACSVSPAQFPLSRAPLFPFKFEFYNSVGCGQKCLPMRTRTLLCLLVLLATVPPAIHAQDPDSAKRFVESLYLQYGAGQRGIDFTGKGAHSYFSENFIRLVRADRKAMGSDMPVYGDADPICDCQDWEGIWQLRITVRMTGKATAEALASFALSDPRNGPEGHRSVRFQLVQEQGGWRIDEACAVREKSRPFCLCEEMKREIRSSAKGQTPSGQK